MNGTVSRKTVVYSRGDFDESLKEGLLLSIAETAVKLNVTRVTVYKWVYTEILTPSGSQKIGKKQFYWFDPSYIDEVKKLLPKSRAAGNPLLNDERTRRIKLLKPHVFGQKNEQ